VKLRWDQLEDQKYKEENRAGEHEVTELRRITKSPSKKAVKERQINYTSRTKHLF